MVSVKKVIRALIFVICLVLFVWQAYGIITEYLEKEIATKVTVKSMDVRHSRFNVAYCLDQYNALRNVFKPFKHYTEEDIRVYVQWKSTAAAATTKAFNSSSGYVSNSKRP